MAMAMQIPGSLYKNPALLLHHHHHLELPSFLHSVSSGDLSSLSDLLGMASKSLASIALLLSLNLLFFTLVSSTYCPPPPPKKPKPTPKPCPTPPVASCPIDTVKLGVCANVLGGLINLELGKPLKKPCCSLMEGLADVEAAVCLCTALKTNILGINLNIPINLSMLVNYCGKKVPKGFHKTRRWQSLAGSYRHLKSTMADLLKDHPFVGHMAAAAGSIAVASSLTHPLDTLKTLLQVGAGPKQQLGLSQVVDKVKLATGLSGLYSGLGWSMLGKISGLGARFGTYEIITAFYTDGREDNYAYVSEALLAGIAAGAFEAVACTPFELLKLRRQVSSASRFVPRSANIIQESSSFILKLLPGYTPDLKAWNNTAGLLSNLSTNNLNLVGALKQYPWMLTGSGRPPLASEVHRPSTIASLEGWSVLWKGLRPGIARDCVYGGIFFSTWQFIHIGMLNWKALDINPPPRTIDDVGPVSPLAASFAAGFSGIVAAAASHTFDTAKSRSQCIVTPKYITMERKLLKWKATGNWLERVAGMSPGDRNFMFRGLWLRMLRSGVSSFVVVGSYLAAVEYIF